MTNAQYSQRQYDRSPELAQAVRMLLLMPNEIGSIIAEGMLSMMDKEFEEILQERHYRSLGSDKIMGLHKSQNRRRAYDQNPILHKAMSHLYLLSGSGQDYMARHILALLSYIQRYLDSCGEFQQEPSLEDVVSVTKTYIEKGSVEVEGFLTKLREEFVLKIFGPKGNPDLLLQQIASPEALNSDEQGMKIQKLNLE
jgi:hypothetical protein